MVCAAEGCDQPRHVTRSGRMYPRCRSHLREQVRRWRLANPEKYRATTQKYNVRYQREHPRDRREWHKAYYQANIERLRAAIRAYSKVWSKANRDKKRSQFHNRRAREMAAFVERVDSAVVWQRDSGVCGICGTLADSATWHLDHIIPLSRGGTHEYANVQVSHPFCNKSKGNRLMAAA